MKCKGKFSKLFAVLVIGLVAFNFSISGINETLSPSSAHYIPTCQSLRSSHTLGHFIDCIPSKEWQESEEPIVYLFRILFILFIISPPLIVLMLILIWKELRERNKMK